MKDVLNGRFSIIETVSKNRLYKAVDTATGKMTAVKKWVNEDSYFEAELRTLKSLQHLNVPQFICDFEENGEKYIAEEWLDGISPQIIESLENIVDFAIALAEFVFEISTTVIPKTIHADIKPSNLIISDGKVYFIDFESSRLLNSEEKIIDKTLKISGQYFTAPEAFYGKYTLQSEIYSIGAVIAWMMGAVDKDGINLSNIKFDSRIKAIVRKCIAQKVEDRYADINELIKDLKDLNKTKNKIDTNIILNQKNITRSFSVYIDCNVFFAWELAAAATSYFGMKTCIIALTERTQKKINYYANTKNNYGSQCVEDEYAPYFLGTESIFKRNHMSWLSKGLLNNMTEYGEKLFYSGTRLPGEAEPESEVFIEDIVKWGKEHFDFIIFVTDRYDDKPAVKNLAAECDFTIATPLANVDDIEACKDYYERFAEHVLYTAWEFNPKGSLPEESIKIMVGEDNYIGAIFHNDEKDYKRNFEGKIQPIFRSDGKESNREYINIINRLFQIVSNPTSEIEGSLFK